MIIGSELAIGLGVKRGPQVAPAATRCEMSNGNAYTSGNFAAISYRTVHPVLGSGCRKSRLFYSARILTGAGEAPAANPFAVKVGIERRGKMVPVTFDGVRTRALGITDVVGSDPVPIALDPNELLPVRTYATSPGADAATRRIPTYNFTGRTELDEWYVTGADMTDAIADTGKVSAANSAKLVGPCAIVGEFESGIKSAVIVASSTGWGQGDVQEAPSLALGFSSRALWRMGVPHARLACPGDTLAQMLANSRWRREMIIATNASHAILQIGPNDVTNGATYAQMVDMLQALWDMMDGLGVKVVQTLFQTVSGSSNNYINAAGQTVDAAKKAVRDQVNAYMATRPHRAIVRIWDPRPFVETADGKWKFDGTANKFTVDGTHISQHGHRLIEAGMPGF